MKPFLLFTATTTIVFTALANAQIPVSLQQEINTGQQMEHTGKMKHTTDNKALREMSDKDIPNITKSEFAADFGNAYNPVWNRIENFDVATFVQNGQSMSAYYDFDAQLVGTTQNKTFADLPLKAQQNIKEHYSDYTPGDVLFFDDNEDNDTDMILYGNQFEDKDSYFVELNNGNKKIVVQASMNGNVKYFTWLK